MNQELKKEDLNQNCAICTSPLNSNVYGSDYCDHYFHAKCLSELWASKIPFNCPLCNVKFEHSGLMYAITTDFSQDTPESENQNQICEYKISPENAHFYNGEYNNETNTFHRSPIEYDLKNNGCMIQENLNYNDCNNQLNQIHGQNFNPNGFDKNGSQDSNQTMNSNGVMNKING